MKKKKNLMASLHAKLMYEIIMVQKRTNHVVFSSYSGHVDMIEIRVAYDGWNFNKKVILLYSKFNPQIKDFKKAIRIVKALK